MMITVTRNNLWTQCFIV